MVGCIEDDGNVGVELGDNHAVVDALIKTNKQFDMLVMPGEEHGGGRRGPGASYGDRKV